MQHYSVCPGCGRLVSTRYPFVHRAGRTTIEFCLASCFVKWQREQQWRQQHAAARSLRPAPEATVAAHVAATRPAAAWSFDVLG